MTLDWSMLQQLLVIAMACSTITIAFVQKTKKLCPNSTCVAIYSFVVNMGVGYLFAKSFTDLSTYYSLWIGFFSFLGADTIYRSLEGKLASYSSLIGTQKTESNPAESVETNASVQEDQEDILGEIPRD